MSNTDPPKNRGRIQMFANGKQFLLLIRHPPCYSYIQSSTCIIRLWSNLPTDLRNSPCQQMLKNELRKVDDMPDKPPF